MPLLDHFHPPLAPARKSGSFHSAWANTITRQLNDEQLPADYYAEPQVQLGNQFEIDVATFEKNGQGAGGTALATATWAPPRPTRTVPVTLLSWDVFEVRVYQELGGPQLRAAIELVSPANKDRPAHRDAFASKCASYLQAGISVVVIDMVTERTANLHAEILQKTEVTEVPAWQSPTNLYTVSYRTVLRDQKHFLEMWEETLTLGAALPSMPLWLEADLCLPLRLEESYAATCAALRMPT